MPETRLVLDPEGYYRTEEEGYDDLFYGRDLHRLFSAGSTNPAPFPGNFWNPANSKHLLCLPRQFDARWYADARLSQHVLTDSLWMFAPLVQHREWTPTHKVNGSLFGTTFTADKWLSIYCPAGVTSLDSCNYSNLATAADVTLLSSMKTIAMCGSTPVGVPLGAYPHTHYTPFIQFAVYPSPYDCIAFGFSNLCLLLFGDKVHLLRTLDGKQTWEQLGIWDRFNYHTGTQQVQQARSSGGFDNPNTLRPMMTAVLCAEVGGADLFLHFANGDARSVRLREPPPVGQAPIEYMPAGAWWIGAADGQKLQGQVQVVGYEIAVTEFPDPTLFKLGSYKPTVPPEENLVGTVHVTDLANIVSTTSETGTVIESTDTGEEIRYQLRDKTTGEGWESTGDANEATLLLSLIPSTAPGVGGAYQSPSILLYELSFEAVLQERVNSLVILSDDEYDDIILESSREQSEETSFTVNLRERALNTLQATGMATRVKFPAHLEELVGGVWTLRAVFWVERITFEEEIVARPARGTFTSPENAERHYQIKGKGLLSRAHTKWRFQPRITEPTGSGRIEHTTAAEKVLKQAHFDVEDPTQVQVQVDPDTGTVLAELPGTWGGTASSTPGDKNEDSWGPLWSETKLRYVQRIAFEWANYLIFAQLSGKVFYVPDILIRLADGLDHYYPKCTLYKNVQNAVAAGVPADQVYAETGQHTVLPKANYVVVRGKDDEGEPDHKFAFAAGTVQNLVLDENFTGEEDVEVYSSRLAVGDIAMVNLAMKKLKRDKRKKVVRRFFVRMAPWDIQGPIEDGLDAGDAFRAQGAGVGEADGDFVVKYVRCWLRHRDVYETTFIAERVPGNANAGISPGTYPGHGVS